VAELLDVGGDEGDCEGPLLHFVDWPPVWDQRVAVTSGRLLPLRSASRGYTGPPSLASKEGVKESFERRVAEKMAQQRDEVSGGGRASQPSRAQGQLRAGGGGPFSSSEFFLVSLCPPTSRSRCR